MPLFARIAAVVLLSFTLSLHWALLQGVAWTSMLVERVQTQSLASAIRTTFDGQHPCKICLAVKQGKAASHTDSSSVPAGVKLEPWVEFDTEPMVSEADRAPASFPGVPAGHSRHERPPLPPPRSA